MEQARRPVAGDIYRHFKDHLYEVITIAIHSETEEEMVVYKQLYGEYKTFARPLTQFLGEVDHEKYPQAGQKYRFELVEQWKKEADVNEILMRFLDARDADEKYRVLEDCDGKVDDRMIDNMAIASDIVISEGSVEDRLSQLRECLRTKARYEGARLR